MIKQLISKYGKDKINTLTKYPSILTLHQMDRGKLKEELSLDMSGVVYATEKIDGTNVRIIMWEDEYLIGSRDNILHYKGDLYFDPAQTIVEGFYNLNIPTVATSKLTVVFGEYYGGKVSSNSKQYGTEKTGFRVFDVVEFEDLSVLDLPLEEISRWREHSDGKGGLVYGQNFLNLQERTKKFKEYEFVPTIEFPITDYSHSGVLNLLKSCIPTTQVNLTDTAGMKPEGVVLRNFDRTKIIKVRYEDYEKTLNVKA